MPTFTSITEMVPVLGLAISIGALLVAYLSYENTKAAAKAAERSADAAERSAEISERSAAAAERSAGISERSADAAERSAEISERSVRAAERSLITTRPFIKLSNPLARILTSQYNTIQMSIQVSNFGALTAQITYGRVDTFDFDGA